MRRLERELVMRGAAALVSMLVVTLIAVGLMQYALLGELMTRQETAYRIAKATRGFLMSSIILIASFGMLSLWIGRLVSRYVAERNRLRVAKDMKLATDIQLGSMPRTFPAFPNQKLFDIYATVRPAKEVGGDFYDFYLARPGHFVFLIADVSGKGVPAALFMMRAKSLLKGFIMTGVPLDEAVTMTNDTLCQGNAAGLFVTAWIADFNPATGRVIYVNAGHNPPIRRRAHEKTAEYVTDEPCLFLGSIPGVPYGSHELQLQPGESIYLYTDGVTEQINPQNELFGEDRLLYCVSNTTHRQKELLDRVTHAVRHHAGTAEQFDDCTQLELVWRGASQVHRREYEPTKEGIALAAADLEAKLAGFPYDETMTILTATDEIFMNIVSYSGATKWSMTVERTEFPTEVTIVIEDDGKPFDPLAIKDPDVSIAIEDRAVGGLGIFIVKKTMSTVAYARRGGKNVLTLGKTLAEPKDEIKFVNKPLGERRVADRGWREDYTNR